MKKINYRDYEDIVTEAVMNVIDGRYNKPLVTEGLGGGVFGILAFFLALFGIRMFGSNGTTLSSSTTTDNSTQKTTATTQSTEQTPTQQPPNSNNSELEALAKKLGLVDVMSQLSGKNIKFDPQYAKALTHYGGHVFYSQAPKAYLTKDMVKMVDKALTTLKGKGYGIIILDATRPETLQKQLADVAKETDTKNGKKYDPSFIAEKNGRHTLGKAIDCTLYVIKTGQTVDMGGDFDERSKRSFTDHYMKSNKTYHNNRMILKDAMTGAGMKNYSKEWWHYYI